MKTIVISASMKLLNRMVEVEKELRDLGFDVLLPKLDEPTDYSSLSEVEQAVIKHSLILGHLEKIRKGDAVLILNEKLKDIDGYIGANAFLEMGFALSLGKKIFLMNPIPDQANSEEIRGMLPEVIHGDLSLLNSIVK